MHRLPVLGLLLVASALASAPAEASSRPRLELALPPTLVPGQRFTATATMTAARGAALVIQRRHVGAWRRWTTVRPERRRVTVRLRAPATSGTVTLRGLLFRKGRVIARTRALRTTVVTLGSQPAPFDPLAPVGVGGPPPAPPPPDETPSDPFAIAPGAETTVSHEGVTLTVPAGTVSAPTTARITPLDEVALGGFGADVHIDGSWEDGLKTVRLSMPLDPDALEPGFEPAVVHYAASGTEIISGHGLSVDYAAGRVSFETTSLSVNVSTALPASWRIVSAPTVTDREMLVNLFARFVGLRANQPTCSPDVTHNLYVSSAGSAFEPGPELGHEPPLKHCVSLRPGEGTEFNRARWTLANNTGAVLRYSTSGGATPVNSEPGGDLLTDVVFATLNGDGDSGYDGPLDSPLYVPPAGAASVTVPAGGEGRVTVEAAPELLVHSFVFRQIGELLDSRSDAVKLYERINACGYTLLLSGLKDLVGALNCARELSSGRIATLLRKVAFLGDAAITASETLTRSLTTSHADLAYADPADPAPADRRFDWGRATTDYLVNVESSQSQVPVPVTPFRYDVSASNTGRIVAFMSDTGTLDPADPGDDTSVYVHDMATGATRWVGDGTLPKVSGDGEHVLYYKDLRLRLHDLSDGRDEEIPMPADNWVRGFDISDDGDLVAFTAEPFSHQPRALLYRRSTERLFEVTLSSAPSDQYAAEDVRVSGNGNVVLFTVDWQNRNNPYLVAYDVETGTDEFVAMDGPPGHIMDLSADGRYVAYGLYEPPSGLRMPETYVLDRQTGDRRLLTPPYEQGGTLYDLHGWPTLSMSDSGRYVAYTRTHARAEYAESLKIEFVVHDVFDGSIAVIPGLTASTVYQPRLTGAGNAIVYGRDTFTTAAEASVRLRQAPSVSP